MMAANEEDLLRRFQASASRDALRELLVVHQDRIYNTCFQVLGRAADAEDAAQEALLKVAEGARSARDADSFRGWIYRVSLRTAIDHWRRREAIRNREARSAMNRPPSPPLDDRERIALFEAMDGLDDRERALLLEHYFEKVPLADLGERRGVSSVAIWKRIDRAREKLKKTLLGAGFVFATPRVSDALEATVPASAPGTLVGEAVLSKILVGGFAVAATKSSFVPAVVIALVLLFGMATGGYFLLRPDLSGKASTPPVAKSAETAVLPSPAAPTPVVDSKPPAVPEPPAKKSPLLETLERYRAWHAELIALQKTPIPPDNPWRNLDFQNEGWKRFKDARAQILEDPETFLEFIKDPANEELVERLIGDMLDRNDSLGRGRARHAQFYKDFPPQFLDQVLDLAKSGSQPVRRGILSFLGQVHDVPERFDTLYEELMYDPDSMIQYYALYARWRQRALEIPVLEKILARFMTTSDQIVRDTAILAISYSPRPETFRWMLDSLEASRDPLLKYRFASAAASMTAKMTPDAALADRLVRNLITTVEGQVDERQQNWLIYSALYMPPKDSVRVLEAALPKAVTPKLKKAIQVTIEKAADGSATWNDLQNLFWRLMKD